MYIVTELCGGSDLWKALRREGKASFGWYNRGQQIALDITSGLHYLHANHIMHLDLKSPNILLDEEAMQRLRTWGYQSFCVRW